MAELDIFQDTTADVAFADTTAMAAEEQTETSEESLQYGDAIDWEATYEDAAKYLGVTAEQWQAFVTEVNAIKAEMNAYEGNVARVMQDRSTPNALRDRRVAVLLNQNPGMTPEEAIAQVEADPNYQTTVSSFGEYEALNSRLNQLYASIGLNPVGHITGGNRSTEAGHTFFNLNTGQVTFVDRGSSFFDIGKSILIGIAGGVATAGIATALSSVMSSTLANAVATTAVNAITGQGLTPEDALSFAFNTILPGSGEVVEPDVIDIAIEQISNVLTNPDSFDTDDQGNVEIVWETHGGTDEIGNPVINLPGDIIVDDESGGGGATGEEPVEETPVPEEQPPEDIFVYDPEHDFIYRGNGVFEQVGEDGKPTGTVYEDPDFTNEDEYPAVVDEAYSIPGTSGSEGPIEPTQEGITVPDVNIIVPPSTGQTPTDSTDVTDGVEDVGQAQGEEGTGAEGSGVEGAGDDGTGEGEGGDGEGEGEDGEEQAPEESSLFAMAGYEPTRPAGIDYELPEIPPLIEALQIDWTSSLASLENRLQQDKLQQRNPSLFDGMV